MNEIEKAIDWFLNYCNGKLTETEIKQIEKEIEKSKENIIDIRQEAYHDIIVYKDGTEKRFYIGD